MTEKFDGLAVGEANHQNLVQNIESINQSQSVQAQDFNQSTSPIDRKVSSEVTTALFLSSGAHKGLPSHRDAPLCSLVDFMSSNATFNGQICLQRV